MIIDRRLLARGEMMCTSPCRYAGTMISWDVGCIAAVTAGPDRLTVDAEGSTDC